MNSPGKLIYTLQALCPNTPETDPEDGLKTVDRPIPALTSILT